MFGVVIKFGVDGYADRWFLQDVGHSRKIRGGGNPINGSDEVIEINELQHASALIAQRICGDEPFLGAKPAVKRCFGNLRGFGDLRDGGVLVSLLFKQLERNGGDVMHCLNVSLFAQA